jgi:hypothetical protein
MRQPAHESFRIFEISSWSSKAILWCVISICMSIDMRTLNAIHQQNVFYPTLRILFSVPGACELDHFAGGPELRPRRKIIMPVGLAGDFRALTFSFESQCMIMRP